MFIGSANAFSDPILFFISDYMFDLISRTLPLFMRVCPDDGPGTDNPSQFSSGVCSQ